MSLLAFSPMSFGSDEGEPIIMPLKDQTRSGGCGCFQNGVSGKKPTYFTRDETGVNYFNLGGKDLEIKLFKKTGPKNLKHDDRFTEIFKKDDVTITVDYMITNVCQPGDEKCEFTGMDATLKASQGKKTQIMRLSGGCGC